MSRTLSELLGAHEPQFTQTLHELEVASDFKGVDIRVSAELDQKSQQKIRELGLDPTDTTGKELYHALQGLTALHDKFLSSSLGIDENTNNEDIFSTITAKISKLPVERSAWVLKHAAARRLLKLTPPKKVMKRLGYRSIDSMLKRENINELFGALRFVESAEWLQRFVRSYKKLRPQDFENRKIEVVALSPARWGELTHEFVAKKRLNVTHLKELGVVVIMPLPAKKRSGLTLAVMLLTLHYIDEIRTYSSYFKLAQVRPDFANILIKTLIYDPKNTVTLIGQPIHWRILRRHFGRQENPHHPEVFEPHVQPEDLRWQRVEEVLYRIEPALKFWSEMDYTGIYRDSRPVSFNLMDNAVSYYNGLEYGEQAVNHMQSSLWNEILSRYIGHKNLEEQVLGQLDNESALFNSIEEGLS